MSDQDKIKLLKQVGEMLFNVMVRMRCCAELREAPEKQECEDMGEAMRMWELAKNIT